MNEPGIVDINFERRVTLSPNRSDWARAPVLILTACDKAYLSHAIALARSMDAFSGEYHLMIHVINPDEADIARLQLLRETLSSTRLHISAEKMRLPPGTSKLAYYASARFIRMAELLAGDDPVPVLALDADALAVGPLTLDFSDKPEAEICLRRRDLKAPVAEHLRVAAGAVWAANTRAASAFMSAVAEDLLQEFKQGKASWFVDQIVLLKHVLAQTGGAHVRNLKTKFVDWSLSDDAVFWTGKGDRKYLDVRYLLLREAFDEDPERRDAARALHARLEAVIPAQRRGHIGSRLRHSLARTRRTRTGIFIPRLDLPWKQAGIKAHGGAPVSTEDTIALRLWWKRFTMELARSLTNYGAEPVLFEIPAWEITPERVDGEDVDLAFIPHRCDFDFAPTRTPRRFYMQEYFRPVFVMDTQGWSAASSAYPVNPATLPPAVLGAWDDYRVAFLSGTLQSKFTQNSPATRAELEARGQIPCVDYIFYPLQIPHDQSIRYFSDASQDEALEATNQLARALGATLVLKEHPANPPSMRPYRERYEAKHILWSDAHLHDLLRHAQGVITINSGAGFEAMLAGKPVVCMGRAEYDAAAHKATPAGLREAWDRAIAEPMEDRLRRYARFVDWFLGRYAVDLSRPHAGRYVLDRLVRSALADAMRQRKALS